MKKLRFIRYLTYFTIILTLLSVLPGGAFAAKASSEGNGDRNQHMQEEPRSSYGNEINNTSDANNSKSDPKRLQNNLSVKDQDRIFEYEQERKQVKEELQLQRKEYQESKKDFLKILDRIRAEELDPNSEEVLNGTKLYLNSSINYMIAHLSNVKSNMEYSKGTVTEEKIAAIDEKIKLLEADRAEVANASTRKELVAVVRSVREVWESAQKISLGGAGQAVSEKIGEFLDKSEILSEKLDVKIKKLKETGSDTSDLEIELTSYKSYIKSAQEKKVEADSIYNDKNVTRENMIKANNYLRQSLIDINKANKLLRQIFEELKGYETD
jgi:hypothetical protein